MISMAFTARSFLFRLAVAVAVVFLFAMLSRAGGPESIAGTSYFDASATGQPLVWPQGQITYYTDQGDLSPVLPNASANSFVANAFSQWTAVPTAALAATWGGQLAEDVTGSNITVSNGVITGPADITPSATGTPIGVVYDYDGSVTDALLGSGAGDSSQCFFNAAYGGNDNFGSAATYQHALIVINGQCAFESSQLVDVEYRLVRVIGNVLGLGWSQLNLNVITGNPRPTAADYAGFPVMHYTDPVSCVPITNCYPNPYQLAMDDIAAISRLYPVTTQNQSNFPGKQVLSSATARIYGSVWFTGPSGNSTQPMQGVNVVARWVDPSTGLPSRQYAASSVSGFLFTGNAGNPITGFNDALGNPFSQWGSDSTTVEGFFDLAGLQLPKGGSGQYQLAVEALDGTWSVGVGPYAPLPVTPSGSSAPITVTVTAGQEVEQDILMAGSAQPVPSWAASETWTAPAPIPSAGNWRGSLSGYGDSPFFLLPAQANRTLSVAVTALDQTGRASESKAQPVIGMWAASDPQGTAPPAFTSSSFNTVTFGMTRLDAQVVTSGNFLIGISDLRGDGRPDYHYQAQVLYADSVSPPRIGVSGGPVTVSGTGLAPGQTASVGTSAAPVLAVNAGQMILDAPPNSDGPESITITDPTTGGSSIMTNALTYGAAASDNLVLLNGHNPPTPVGTQAPYAVIVQGRASDGVTPVAGATIGWSATNGVQLSACSSSSSCTVTTDASGGATTWLTPTTVGTATITATLAPGVYSPAESVNATLSATESSSDIGVSTTYLVDLAGSYGQHSAEGARSLERRGPAGRDGELQGSAGNGHAERGQRNHQLHRLRHGNALGHRDRRAGAGERLRGAGQCSLPDHLRQPRAPVATAARSRSRSRASLHWPGVSARGRARDGFLVAAESRARGASTVPDHRPAARRIGSRRRQRRNQSHQPRYAGHPERDANQRHNRHQRIGQRHSLQRQLQPARRGERRRDCGNDGAAR